MDGQQIGGSLIALASAGVGVVLPYILGKSPKRKTVALVTVVLVLTGLLGVVIAIWPLKHEPMMSDVNVAPSIGAPINAPNNQGTINQQNTINQAGA